MNRTLAAGLALLLAVPGGASAAPRAKQAAFDVDKGAERWRFHYRFVDEASRVQSLYFELPAERVARDNDVPLQFPMSEAVKSEVAAVRRYADTHPGPKITASAKGGAVSIKVSGKNAEKMRGALKGAAQAADDALDLFLARHRYTRLRSGGISPDHARLADQYADDVAPLASALAHDAPDARTYVERALTFVQSIPYESGKTGKDKGYRRPLSVLARNKGDCDSKTTLFLALVRAEHAELQSTVVYVPNHAFAGVALTPEPGDRSFVRDEVTYVGMEPVGPAKLPAGRVSGKAGWHLFWGSAEARALRVGAPAERAETTE